MSTRAWHLAVAVILLVLLGAVATLQYRWVGEITAAERERLQTGVRTRGAEFAAAVDQDVTRAFAAFQADPAAFERDPGRALADAAERAARETATGAAVKGIYVAEPGTEARLRQLDMRRRILVDTDWPAGLSALRARVAAFPKTAVPGLPLLPGLFDDPLDRVVPALIVPITAPAPPLEPRPGQLLVRSVPETKPWHAVLVWLDIRDLRARLLAPAAERLFGDPQIAELNLSVIDKRSQQPIYESGAAVALAAADFTSDLFAVRVSDLVWSRVATPASSDPQIPPRRDQVAITILRRETAADAAHIARQGALWTLAVQAKRGSLDAVVARSRRRNLAVGLGVVGVLGAGLGLILVTSARERRIARQQLEFVASVSHELRTPLAVIRSAAENLSDEVVRGEHVRVYGALIRTEGRRLSDMIDRIMDFAGLSAGTLIRTRAAFDLRAAIERAVAAVSTDARDRGVVIDVRHPARPSRIVGDANALVSALQNVVGNAVKYSQAGGRVEVDVDADDRRIRIAVSDRGIGVDDADLPHVFKPFYRGRRAIDSQTRGSGVGLSVVQKIVEAHGGCVTMAPRDGGGTLLLITLPAVAPDAEQA